MAAITVMKRVNHINFFLLLSLTCHYFWKSTFKKFLLDLWFFRNFYGGRVALAIAMAWRLKRR